MITVDERALMFAAAAHGGQIDKGGNSYIWHPIRVALNFDHAELRAVALLHDVLEDTDATEDRLRDMFGDPITDAVVALTKTPDQDYQDFIRQCADNFAARMVKIADLTDNMDIDRLPRPIKESDILRLKKYANAVAYLKSDGLSINTENDQ